MDPVPPDAQRELVDAQLARVEEAVELDVPKCASHRARNSSARYSRRCHGLSERSAPRGASVSTLGVDT